MTNKQLEEELLKIRKAVITMDGYIRALTDRLNQLEFSVTGGIPANPPKKSVAEVTKAAGNPGGSGGDFV